MQPFWAQCENRRLAALWRGDDAAKQVWVMCPPLAEEEKSARGTLTEIARALQNHGHSSLLFSYSGTGDSEGDFASASLDAWRAEITAMCYLARERSPEASLILCGVRLGASLAAQMARECAASELWLLEPVLDGKTYLAQLGRRRRLRGMLTDASSAHSAAPEDLDGWPLGQKLKAQLEELRLGQLPLPAQTHLWQIGGRREVSPALLRWADLNQLQPKVLLMPPFWNRLDAVPPQPLLEALGLKRGSDVPPLCIKRQNARELLPGETPFLIPGKSGALSAIVHLPPEAKSTFIVMLHGWSGYRTGPHQMLTRAARRFAALGFPVLRFDLAGRGDSDGNSELATLATMNDDLQCVLQWVKSTFDVERVVLSGLCSGCEVAFAGAAASEIKGLMLWSAPVFAAGASSGRSRRKRWHHLGEYARKMLRVSTYRKLLRGEVDARAVSKVLSHQGGETKNIENDLPGQLPRGWRQNVLEQNRKLNLPALLIFGTADPTAQEALVWYEKQFPRSCHVEKHWIEGANHSYYGLEWEKEVIDRSAEWLAQYFD